MKRIYLFFAMLLMLSVTVFTSCENELPPTVRTELVSQITETSCVVDGEIVDQGSSVVIFDGVCWGTEIDPDTVGNHMSLFNEHVGFSYEITGLNPETDYYVRAYAVNLFGIGYGESVKFTTLPANIVIEELPVVSTDEVQEITESTALCGGKVVSEGSEEVTEIGLCWSVQPNPTIESMHWTVHVGEEFNHVIQDLTPSTTYYVRAYAINSVGIGYGNEVNFTTLDDPNFIPDGALSGVFTLSEHKKIRFSRGNLQYQASSDTWRFAENQWDYVGTHFQGNNGGYGGTVEGSDNADLSSNYDGWIDLFGWGTSGHNHGGLCYQPWSNSADNTNYYAYGQMENHLYDQTGEADWGCNAISNGGNQANYGWRTLTFGEWLNLFAYTDTPSGIRYAKANVNEVNGVVLLPDDWSSSYYHLSQVNDPEGQFSSNTISADDWKSMEEHGAVFLPVSGCRFTGFMYIEGVNTMGRYWSSTRSDTNTSYCMSFRDGEAITLTYKDRSYGQAVRLVLQVK